MGGWWMGGQLMLVRRSATPVHLLDFCCLSLPFDCSFPKASTLTHFIPRESCQCWARPGLGSFL